MEKNDTCPQCGDALTGNYSHACFGYNEVGDTDRETGYITEANELGRFFYKIKDGEWTKHTPSDVAAILAGLLNDNRKGAGRIQET